MSKLGMSKNCWVKSRILGVLLHIRIEQRRADVAYLYLSLSRMTENYRLRSTLKHDAEVCGIAICTDKIVTSSYDRGIRIWTGHGEDLWKPYLLKPSFLTPSSTVRCISWIPPNRTLKSGGVSGCSNNDVLVWDVDSGNLVERLNHESQVTGIVVDGDDLVSSSMDGTLNRWRNWECTETWAAHEGPIQAVIKLPTGELVTGSRPISGSRESILKIWKGKVCLHTFGGHTDTVCGLAAMSDYGILSASHDGSLRLWALNGHEIMNMSGHTATVCSVDSLASGLIVSGSEDCLAKIWKDFNCVQSLKHPLFVRDTKFMENGDIVTACSDGLVRIWTVDQNHFASQEELESKLNKLRLNDIDEVPVDIGGKTLQYNRSEVAEKPEVECVVNTDPMRFRPTSNMGDMTDHWNEQFKAMIKGKKKVAEKPEVKCVVYTDPMRFRPTSNMGDMTDHWNEQFKAMIKGKKSKQIIGMNNLRL